MKSIEELREEAKHHAEQALKHFKKADKLRGQVINKTSAIKPSDVYEKIIAERNKAITEMDKSLSINREILAALEGGEN